MSPWLAVTLVTWAALIVLYLGLAATLRQVKSLAAELAALRAGGDARSTRVDLLLPGLADPDGPATRLVVAADTGCPACHGTVETLAALASGLPVAPVLLTHEPPRAWQDEAGPLEIRQDPDSWRALRHLSPPVLLTVDRTGRIVELALPTAPDDVPKALAAWGFHPLTAPQPATGDGG